MNNKIPDNQILSVNKILKEKGYNPNLSKRIPPRILVQIISNYYKEIANR